MTAFLLRWWMLLLLGVCLAVLLGQLGFSSASRVRRLLRKSQYAKAYAVACRGNVRNLVRNYLGLRLRLPAECLRESVLELFDHLVNLDRSAADSRNAFVEPGFMADVRQEVDGAFGALWETCLNLEIVAAQNVRFDPDHIKVLEVADRLSNLSEASEHARIKLAELSLGTGRENAEEAELALRIVGRQAEALSELES